MDNLIAVIGLSYFSYIFAIKWKPIPMRPFSCAECFGFWTALIYSFIENGFHIQNVIGYLLFSLAVSLCTAIINITLKF